jgi:hypothetical protein
MRKMNERTGTRLLAAGLAALALVTACTDKPSLAPIRSPLDTLVIVSAPSAQSSAVSNGSGTGAQGALPSGTAGAGTLVFVSLPPGSVPGASSATILNRRTGTSIAVAVLDGGFDPSPIAASVDDILTIDIRAGSSDLMSTSVKVPRRRPPSLVRSQPPQGKTDVPLNSRIEVVLSEPVDPATIPASMGLVQGTRAVAGRASLDPSGLVATFAPDSSLAPYANYTVVVTTGLRNLAGDALEQGARIDFTTGANPAPPPVTNEAECLATSPSFLTGPFERVHSMALARKGLATRLPDGRVLIVGGLVGNSTLPPQAEVYDPATRTFGAADQMMTTRGGHQAVTLPQGKLLFLDGVVLQDGRVFFAAPVNIVIQLTDGPFAPPSNAEIYDPASGTFTLLGPYAHTNVGGWTTATLLLDGRVLLTGYETIGDSFSGVTELFDPRSNTFKKTGAMQGWVDTAGWGTLLTDGTVLFVQWNFLIGSDAVEIYDPATETFSMIGRIYPNHEYSQAVRLADGRVLVTGGQMAGGDGSNETLLYLSGSRTFGQGPPMTCGRHEHSATLLLDGTVLIAGGYSSWPSRTATAEIFNPAINSVAAQRTR